MKALLHKYVKNGKKWIKSGLFVCLVGIISVVFTFPFFVMISTLLRGRRELFHYPVIWIPNPAHWENLVGVWKNIPLASLFRNNIIIALGTITLVLLFSIPAAFGLSFLKIRIKSNIIALLLITQMFSPIFIIVPLFKIMQVIGLLDSLLSVIIAETIFNVAVATLMIENTFEEIPKAIAEAAKIDGCSNLQLLIKILLPLSAPGLVGVIIFVFILSWNDFIFPFTFLSSMWKNTVIVGIYRLVSSGPGQEIRWDLVMAASLYASLPTQFFFFSIRKYLVKGLTAGGVK